MSLPDFDFYQYVTEICKGIKSRPQREEVMEELLCHLEDNYERNLAVGMNEDEARLDAINKMGDSAILSYRLSAVHSYSPLQAMSSAFFALIAGYICMNFFFNGIVQDILIIFGIAFMFSPLLRMRKINGTMEKAFHFFNFSVLIRLLLYCLRLGRILPVHLEAAISVAALLSKGLFWFFLFTGLCKVCKPHIKEGTKEPRFYFCGIYHLVLSFFNSILIILAEGEDVNFDAFILPWFMIFMYFFGTVQLIRTRNILWGADGEYGILPRDKKHITAYLCVVAVLISTAVLFNFASSTREPDKTELIIHDVSQEEQLEADKVRQKLLDWDVERQIVEDLPDSEILKYKDAEFVTWGADGGSMGGSQFETGAQSDLWYYWFYIPDEEYEGNYEVRLLCYIESHYAYSVKRLYRKGFYYVPWGNGIFPLNLYDELNGSFISIVTEENGKKYNAEPFFTYNIKDLEDGYPTDYPKGFEYHEEKGQRVYYATQIGITNTDQSVSLYGASVRQRTFSPFQYYNTAGFIETVMNAERITSRSGELYPFAYRLHAMNTGNLDDKVFDLETRQSYEYSEGYPKIYY